MALAWNKSEFSGMTLFAGVLSITQSIPVPRRAAAFRKTLFLLATIFVLRFWIRQDPSLFTGIAGTHHSFHGHPIENLITSNRAHFTTLLGRQSKTVEEAVAEYQRRYGRRPPLGFDRWFELAKQHDFVLVDEFDTFMQSLEPFHGIDPSVIEQRIRSVENSDVVGRMVMMRYGSGDVFMSENMADIGARLTEEKWLDIIPYNMTVLLNGWDESMVSASWDAVSKSVQDAKKPKGPSRKLQQTSVSRFVETGKQNGWATTMHACSIYSPSRQVECPERNLTTPLSFISNATYSKDVCQNCALLQEEGLIISPENMRVSHELVPIWSASKPSHFHDILYPSSYYIGVRGDYKPEMDSPWASKDNTFYWVGSATGGWVTQDNWDQMQRQRLVLKTMKTNADEPVQFLEETEPGSDKWRPRYSTMAEIADLFATRISAVVQCTDEACEIEKEAFNLTEDPPWDPQDAAYSHKFVMDLDGNRFSGRYYRLLRSRSVVVKQTILKEWHDDRLIPWVHYVPVSTGYHELPEMARFLTSSDRGLRLSERIARESTEWHDRTLRDVDLRLVFLRMLLEYGRVMNPEITY